MTRRFSRSLFWALASAPLCSLSLWSAELSSAVAPLEPASCHADMPAQPGATAAAKPPLINGPYIAPNGKNVSMSDSPAADGKRTKVVIFKDILIDKIYPSMRGPWTRTYAPMDTTGKEPYIWITRYRAEVMDGDNGKNSQEFMCHTKLDISDHSKPGMPVVNSEFVISQGQDEIQFPSGYGLKILDNPYRQLDINVMVLNNNYPDIHKNVDFKATVDYIPDAIAVEQKLKPLFVSALTGACLTQSAPGDTQEDPVCESASGQTMIYPRPDGRLAAGHWIVPPGRQVVRTPATAVTPYDTTIHYILMHVHPYAESFELRDVTTGKSVWKGKVKNAKHQATILNTEHYSSPVGLPIYKEHRYELVATYNNRTDHPIDAMASLWMYLQQK